jgi:hypothetical protein
LRYREVFAHTDDSSEGGDATLSCRIPQEAQSILSAGWWAREWRDLGATVAPDSQNDFGAFLAEETTKWGRVIAAAHITAE